MPEPITLSIIAVTAVTVAFFGYKTADTIVNAPAKLVETAGTTARDLLRGFSDELQRLFGAKPRLSVDRVVIQQAPISICELCLAKSEIAATAEIEENWMGSTKRFRASQVFILKAGYDLNRLKFDYDSKRKHMRVTVSEATILNVIQKSGYQTEREENGFWNRLNAKDREIAIHSLPEKAREEAKTSGVFAHAQGQLKLVFERMFNRLQISTEVVCQDESVVFEESRLLPEMSGEAMSRLGLEEARSSS